MGDVSLRKATIGVAGRRLIEQVDLDILAGELCVIVGPNGAGKTTLLRTIAGALAPLEGTVHVGGRAPYRLSPRERAKLVTLVGRSLEVAGGMTVREVVATARYARHPWWAWNDDPIDDEAVSSALDRTALSQLSERRLETLSSGEAQRALLALALAQETRAILLDEPTSHLDVRASLEILELVRALAKSGATIVAVLHDLNEAASVADRVAIVGEKHVLGFGPPRAAFESDALERAYGVAFERMQDGNRIHLTPRTSL